MFKIFDPIGFVNRILFMPCLQLNFWGAVIGAAVSLYSGNKAGKAANAAGGASLAMQQEKLAFAKEQYADYKKNYGGMEQDLIASIDDFAEKSNLARYTGEGVADVRQAYGKAEEMGKRKLSRYGIDPGDQRFTQQQRSGELEEAKSEVFARNKAREKLETDQDKLFSKRLAAGRFGKVAPGQAKAVSEGYGEMADAYGREAEGYGKQASKGYGLAGKFIGKAADGMTYSGGFAGNEEAIWEGSNYVEDADTGELGW